MHYFSTLHFLRPYWLLLLLFLPWLIYRLWKDTHADRAWHSICDAHLLPYLLIDNQNIKRRWPYALFFVGIFFAIIALAGPSWSQTSIPVYHPTRNRVIVIDLSTVMDAIDIPPSRLSIARDKILNLLNRWQGDQIGVIAFTAEPFTVAPLTMDSETLRLLIPMLQTNIMPIQGNNISAALNAAAQLLQQAHNSKGQILLLTASSANDSDDNTAKNLHQQGITLDVLGMGTIVGGPIAVDNGHLLKDANGNITVASLDETSLQQLANAGGGQYMRVQRDNNDLDAFTQQTSSINSHLSKQKMIQWHDEGRWFILIMLPLLLLAFRRGWLEELIK